jgi:AcrR family transcriptional regulator
MAWGTSIEEIAAQAGVSKSVVYEHFGTKGGLYAVVVDREVERFLTMTTRLASASGFRRVCKPKRLKGGPVRPGEPQQLPLVSSDCEARDG